MPRESDHWLEKKEKELGRPLRVLFVGNIANNAYLNAKFLREVGVEVDVISYDYSHIMSCPEWEDLEINHDYKSDYFPLFDKRDTHGYERPPWFIQGAFPLCYLYIQAKFQKKFIASMLYSKLLRISRSSADNQQTCTNIFYAVSTKKYYLFLVCHSEFRRISKIIINTSKTLTMNAVHAVFGSLFTNRQIIYKIKKVIKSARNIIFNKTSAPKVDDDDQIYFERFSFLFNQCFPDRTDKLVFEDILPYLSTIKRWSKVFSHYDLVQCYSTDPILALLSEAKPYIAFEHGTLRAFTMGDNPIHRLNALAYRCADHVFITNGDCLDYANRLGISKFSSMIHPIPEYRNASTEEKQNVISNIKKQLNAQILLFCPLRHDWAIKGTDHHIRAFKEISRHTNGKSVLLLVNWGLEVERSKKLIKELGFEAQVRWVKPLSRKNVMDYMIASDVILDQMALPCFGATAPQAIALEVPVIMSYSPESTSWIISEEAPIIAAFKAEDVVKGVMQALDPQWLEDYKHRARTWFKSQHHSTRIVADHLEVYKELLKSA